MIFYQRLYTKLLIYGKKTIFEKITLPSQNLRYLGSGKRVFRLIPKGCDTFVLSKRGFFTILMIKAETKPRVANKLLV